MNDSYHTLRGRAEFRQKIDRSDFLGIAFPIDTEGAFFAELYRIAKQMHDATHHCWAFRLFEQQRARGADAGEPSGTAGRPILSAIESAGLFDAAIIVVRWFGGIKLGTGGLSRAYRDTATGTLRRAEIVERILYDRVRVVVPFDRVADAYRLIDPPSVLLAGENYGDINEFSFDVRRSRRDEFAAALASRHLTLR